MTRPQRLSRWWYAGIAMVSAAGYWYATDSLTLEMYPSILLPFLLAWLAYRYPGDISTLLLWVGVLTAFGIGYDISDTLSFNLGFGVLFATLAIAAVYAVARPVPIEKLTGLLNHRWRRLRWLIPVALWLSIYVRDWPTFEFGDYFSLGFDLGLTLLAIIVAGSIKSREAYDAIRSRLINPDRPWLSRFKVLIVAVLVLAVITSMQLEIDYVLALNFGIYGGIDLLLAVVIVVAAIGLIDWRIMIGALLVFFALEWPIFWTIDFVDSALVSLRENQQADSPLFDETPDVLGEIVISGSRIMQRFWLESGLILGLSSILMATAFAPFIRSRAIGDLYTRRAAGFIAAAFVVIFSGMISVSYGLTTLGYFFAGVVAYLCGLRWQVRGMLLSPLVIQFGYLFFVQFMSDQDEMMYNTLNVTNLALYTFAFAYFGFLSNRLLDGRRPENHMANGRGESA